MPQHAAAIGWAIGGTQPVRASLAFLLSAAALLPVAACAELTDVSHLTVAEQTEICGENLAATQIVATGRRTGELDKDYRCRGIHATSYGDRRDRNVQSAAGARNTAIDRTLSRGG
jgi:hypothetical protein